MAYNPDGYNCPACHRGLLEPADYCPVNREECSKDCPDYEYCFEAQDGVKCNRCDYIARDKE